jgi:hypothetical protein
MTTLCSGGSSAPKAGVAETIIFAAGSLGSLLNNRGGYWASIAAPLLGVLSYSATSLCSTDPPAQPTISDDEYRALLQLGPWDDLQTALVKLADIITRVVWFDMCECTSVTTPPLPATTLAPPVDVFLPDYSAGASCPQPRVRLVVPRTNMGGVYRTWTNITTQVFPGFPTLTSVASAGTAEAQPIIATPPNWGTWTMVLDYVSGTSSGTHPYAVTINGYDGNRQMINTLGSVQVRSGATHQETNAGFSQGTWPYFSVNTNVDSTGYTTDGVVDFQLRMNCTAGGPAGTGCCSDTATIALLSQIMQQVNLIQRQNVPFAYVPGTVHAGLTGTGQITVQGLIGTLVEVTAGTNFGTASGTPDQIFEAGWITWGNADGFTQREFLANETLVSLPAAAGQYTRIGYTLGQGVTVTITELEREP